MTLPLINGYNRNPPKQNVGFQVPLVMSMHFFLKQCLVPLKLYTSCGQNNIAFICACHLSKLKFNPLVPFMVENISNMLPNLLQNKLALLAEQCKSINILMT